MTGKPKIDADVSRPDPVAVEWVQPDSDSPVLLVCEHAGQAIPQYLKGLALPPGAIDLHIGWDIGAERLARALAQALGAPLILQRYSRLVMDCNRPPEAPGAMPEVSDGIAVPGNLRLDAAERLKRRELIFDPFNRAIDHAFAVSPRRAAFSIHSFTRQMRDGDRRIWDAGFLCRRDPDTAQTLLKSIGRSAPHLTLALNEPYRIEDENDWFIPRHAEPRGVRHTLIEVCNDTLQTKAQIARWSDLISRAIEEVLQTSA